METSNHCNTGKLLLFKEYFNHYAFIYKTGRRMILDWIVAIICCMYSTLNFFINALLICYCCPQIMNFSTFLEASLTVLTLRATN